MGKVNTFWRRRWQQFVALILLLNFALVVFDLSYLPLRSFYLQRLPAVVDRYDPVKGVIPHPVTEAYLTELSQLRKQVSIGEFDEGLRKLQQRSITLIEENPYAASGQFETFARLKRRLQTYTSTYAAQDAFKQLWQPEQLVNDKWLQIDAFLQREIEPLLSRAYFRKSTLSGQYIDRFWLIDIPFIVFFLFDFVGRVVLLAREKQISLRKAVLRRWYDLPLLLPVARWLRAAPVVVRVHRTNVLNLNRVVRQLAHEPVAYIADRAAKYTVAQVLSQVQKVVASGAVVSALAEPDERIEMLSDRLIRTVAVQVLPTLESDIENLLRYSLKDALTQSALYDTLGSLPGLSGLSETVLSPLADVLARTTCTSLAEAYTDAEGQVLLDRLSEDFRLTLFEGLRQQATAAEMQALIVDLLETVKQNYVTQAHRNDSDAMLKQVNEIERQIKVP